MNPAMAAAIAAAFVAGTLVALQAPTNALLSRAVGSPVNAAFVSFLVGVLALAVVALGLGVRPNVAEVRSLPWYAWIGGLYGAVFVAVAAFAAPRMGITFFLIVGIGGQLAMAVYLDKVGAFGLAPQEIGLGRIAGLFLVIAGAWLVQQK